MQVSFDSFARDPRLMGRVFGRPSYLAMRASIKAALAEPLDDPEREVFARLAGGRDPPPRQVGELVCIFGRGSGKTQGAAGLAIYLACCREWPTDPGQIPVILLLAADKVQAKIAFKFIEGMLRASPLLRTQVESTTSERIILSTGVEIVVAASDYRSVRGPSLAAVLADELAHWPINPDSDSPDTETLNAVRPGLARFRDSMLIAISTPFAARGALYEYDQRSFGENDPRVLVLKADTITVNPLFDAGIIEKAYADDEAKAAAEYGVQYRADCAAFLSPEHIDPLIRSEPLELPPHSAPPTHFSITAAVDVSGGQSDAAAAAVVFRDREKVRVAAARRWPAPHDAGKVAKEIIAFFKPYGVRSAIADQYGSGVAKALYNRDGFYLRDAPMTRSEAYLGLLPLLSQGVVELPPLAVLRSELLGLQRRVARTGRDSVDHGRHSHDDLANAVALGVVQAMRTSLMSADDWIAIMSNPPPPTRGTELGVTPSDPSPFQSSAFPSDGDIQDGSYFSSTPEMERLAREKGYIK